MPSTGSINHNYVPSNLPVGLPRTLIDRLHSLWAVKSVNLQPTNGLTIIATARALLLAVRQSILSYGSTKNLNKYLHCCYPLLSFDQPTASRGWDELHHWMSFSHLLIRMRMALQGCPVHCQTWETPSVIYPTPVAVPIYPLANVPVRAAMATRLGVTSTRVTRRMYPVTVQLSSAQR